ncbi:MAG TPA: hypothetical protein VNT32_00325 [Thermoleophilaceae bacterium]|nr:hypothetical protein [Thermoleophilaceae bacterium]
MRRPTLPATVLAAVAAAFLVAPASSGAAILGIGDQKPNMFSDPLFQQLGSKRARYIVPFNAALNDGERAAVDQWMAAAVGARQEIMVAFNHSSDQRCPAQPCRAASVSEYTRAVRAFHARYGRFVKIYQPWNESNSRTQPTAGNRGARLVAKYYKALKKIAGRRRLVTGADIQDIGDFRGYTRTFLRAVGRKPPSVIGMHNYTDTNRFSFKSTDRLVKVLPRKTKLWLTETGAIYFFQQQNGTVSLPADENRARRSMTHLFKIIKRHRRKIDRVYIYQWQKTNSFDRFDAGVVNEDGSPRSSYTVLRKNRRSFR